MLILNEFQARIKQQYPIVNKQYNVIEGSVIIRVLVDIDKIVKAAVIEEPLELALIKLRLNIVKITLALKLHFKTTPRTMPKTVSIYVSPW